MTTYFSRPSTGSTNPPGYTTEEQQQFELARLSSSSSPSILSAPPPYDDFDGPSSRAFRPTVHLQIQTAGKPWLSLPTPPRPDPIPVFALHPDDPSTVAGAAAGAIPQFTSFRPERYSGSCYLQQTSSSGSSTVVATTTYRFGPGRPPVVRLFSPFSSPSPAAVHHILYSSSHKNKSGDDDHNSHTTQYAEGEHHQQQEGNENGAWDMFTVSSLGLLTRAVGFRSRLGSFQWRYARRGERRAFARELSASEIGGGGGAGNEADIANMLVLERVVRVAVAQSGTSAAAGSRKDEEEVRTVVARFIRGEDYRSPGSGASTAGNGGRLLLDLGIWEGEDGGKGDREMAVAMVVTTCLIMLKREIDRRRAQQIAIMSGAASGG
ncbi:hypothetical protein VTI28DRAFT_6200 [Corynascus sepedonium]